MKSSEPEIEMIQKTDAESEKPAVLSDQSPIRLGLLFSLFSFTVVVLGAGAWYLATSLAEIKTTLNTLVKSSSEVQVMTLALERRQTEHEKDDANNWKNLETRVSIVEQVGSPKTKELEKEVHDLQNEFKVYKAINGSRPMP